MKLAFITDTHIGARSDSHIFNKYMIEYWENEFIPYLLQNQINTVIHFGDVFDRRKYVNFGTLNAWREKVFMPLEKHEIQMHYIIGNHDCFHKNTNTVNSVKELLSRYSNTHIYEEAEEMWFEGTNVLFVPWINEYNKNDTIKKIESSQSKICMGHLEIIGFEIQKGAINLDKGLSKDVFNNFEKVFTGHFHHRSIDGNIFYLGSPYETTWSDYDDPRGFHIFDLQRGTIEFLRNETTMFRKMFYADQGKTFEQIIEENRRAIDNIVGKYIKVVVKEKTNFYIFDQFIEEVQKHNPADLTVVENFLDDDLLPDELCDTIDQSKNAVEILKDYVGELNVSDNADKMINLFQELYAEAVSREISNE